MRTCCIQGCQEGDDLTDTEREESRCMRSSWRKHASGFVLADNHVETGYCPFMFQMLGYDLALYYRYFCLAHCHNI